MQLDYNCINCTKGFSVKGVGDRPADVPETKLTVNCPFCQTSIVITWPQGSRYIVVPK